MQQRARRAQQFRFGHLDDAVVADGHDQRLDKKMLEARIEGVQRLKWPGGREIRRMA